MGIARDERRALCDLFTDLGPDAPTLCAGWRTRDLAAHLVVRERRPDALPGILLPPLAARTRSVQDSYAAQPWPELVELVRSGPAKYWPTAIGKLDELTNSAEFLVHHEDVRRAQEGWEPRPADAERDKAAWSTVKQLGRLMFRKSPVGVVLRTPNGQEAKVKAGADAVTVIGEPVELLLFAFGRDEVRLTFDGADAAVASVQGLTRGL